MRNCYAPNHLNDHVYPWAPVLHRDRRVRTGQVGTAAYNVQTSGTTEPFTHFFETCVGSGHMSLTLREDWRGHLRMAARVLTLLRARPCSTPPTLATCVAIGFGGFVLPTTCLFTGKNGSMYMWGLARKLTYTV